ncbi:MAG: hypothetical protein MJZ75_02470 [Paludibacteraceae bacterium]|nr:hypothetical protein [Paludibacteraceae bacterium]
MNKYPIKYSKFRVRRAIRRMAKRLKKNQVIGPDTVFVVMLNGGVWFSSRLFDCLGDLTNEVYYLKGHSYNAQSREDFVWDYIPDVDFTGRDIVVIDDISDSGETLKAVYNKLNGIARSFAAVTLLQRIPRALPEEIPLYSCIDDASSNFFVGCGLDCEHGGRLLAYIAVARE